MLHTGDRVRMEGDDYRGTVLGEIGYSGNWFKIVSWDSITEEPSECPTSECPTWALVKIND